MANATVSQSSDELLMIRLLHGMKWSPAGCPVELIDVATGTRRAFPSLQALVDYLTIRPPAPPAPLGR